MIQMLFHTTGSESWAKVPPIHSQGWGREKGAGCVQTAVSWFCEWPRGKGHQSICSLGQGCGVSAKGNWLCAVYNHPCGDQQVSVCSLNRHITLRKHPSQHLCILLWERKPDLQGTKICCLLAKGQKYSSWGLTAACFSWRVCFLQLLWKSVLLWGDSS